MFERLYVMLMKEFIELKRDRWAIFRLVVPLVLQVIIYGYAATFTVNHVATAVLDLDRSQASRNLISISRLRAVLISSTARATNARSPTISTLIRQPLRF